MIPIIYPSDATTFKRRGYGALSDCISCSVTEVLNGEYSLELRYPKNGVYQEYLLVRNIIVCSANHTQSLQAFRIYKVNRSLNNYIVVYAYQWSYDLSGYIFYTAPLTIRGGLERTLETFNSASSHFVFSTDKTSSAPFTIDVPSSVRSWFGGKEGSLIDVYGGEWYFDFDVCQLLSRRGSDSGVRISYGVNIAQYIKEITDNVYSEVYGYWAREDDNGQMVVVNGAICETGATAIHRALCLDVTDKFEEQPTSNQITTYTQSYINSHNLTGDNQTITIEPSILKNEVGLGDTVHVCYDDAVVDTRVVQTVWDSLSERYTKLVLGTVKENIAETIKALGVSSSSGGSGGGGGSSIIIDSALSLTSTNPVQNKVITSALNNKQNQLTAGDNITIVNNVISATGGGAVEDVEVDGVSVLNAENVAEIDLTGKQNRLTLLSEADIDEICGDTSGLDLSLIDDALSSTSKNPVQNKVIYNELFAKSSAVVNVTPLSGSNYANYGNTYYYKVGSRVHVHVGVQGLTANATNHIVVLPSGYRPRTRVGTVGHGATLASSAMCACTVYADGYVDIFSPSQYAIADIEFDAF